MALRRAALPVALVALVAAACSAGSGSSPATGSAPSSGTAVAPAKAQFLERANAVCRDMQTKGQALTTNLGTATDEAALPQAMRQMAGVVDDGVNQLRALTPPPGDEATVGAAIDSLAATAQAARKLADTSASNDQAAVSAAVTAQTNAQKASDTAMQAYGLTACVFGT